MTSTSINNGDSVQLKAQVIEVPAAVDPNCETPVGLTTSPIVHDSAVFTWSAVEGAAGYIVQFRERGGDKWKTVTIAASEVTYTAKGLKKAHYEWRVKTICKGVNAGNSAYAAPAWFDSTGAAAFVPARKDYYWEQSTRLNSGLSAATGDSVMVKPTSTTTYTVCATVGDTSLRDTITLNVHQLAAQQFQVSAALYNNIAGIPDNDPPGFTQYYAVASVPLNKADGIAVNSKGKQNYIWFRNLYFTPVFNGSSLNYVPVDSVPVDSTHYERHVNSLDLYQYAYVKLPVNLNIFTRVVHNGGVDKFHIYCDLLSGLMFTKDTSQSIGSHIIPSWLLGLTLAAKTKSDMKGFTFNFGTSLFTINPWTNSVKGDLSMQYRNLNDTLLDSNRNKEKFDDHNWYWKLEGNIMYGVNSSTTTYIHFNYINSFMGGGNYTNSYFQIQLGVNVNIIDFFSKYADKDKASGSQTLGLN